MERLRISYIQKYGILRNLRKLNIWYMDERYYGYVRKINFGVRSFPKFAFVRLAKIQVAKASIAARSSNQTGWSHLRAIWETYSRNCTNHRDEPRTAKILDFSFFHERSGERTRSGKKPTLNVSLMVSSPLLSKQ